MRDAAAWSGRDADLRIEPVPGSPAGAAADPTRRRSHHRPVPHGIRRHVPNALHRPHRDRPGRMSGAVSRAVARGRRPPTGRPRSALLRARCASARPRPTRALPGGSSPASTAANASSSTRRVWATAASPDERCSFVRSRIGPMLAWTAASSSSSVLPNPLACPAFSSSRSWPQRVAAVAPEVGEVRRVGHEVGRDEAGHLLGRRLRRVGEVSVEEQVMGVVDGREDEHRSVTRLRAPDRHERHERHEVLGDPHVGLAVAGGAQRGGAHPVVATVSVS